jgi:hypothetical protein
MGIDIYLEWDGQTEEDKKKMATGFSTTSGDVGYLREAYHGGPYATQILLREAFESEDCRAQIPAAVLRERLTNVTEPARGKTAGHDTAAAVFAMFTELGMADTFASVKSALTEPQTVEEAIYERCKNVYPDDGETYAEQVVQSFRDFVSLAERKERETGKPCTVYASY